MIFWGKKAEETAPAAEKKTGALARLKEGLARTRSRFAQGLSSFFAMVRPLDEKVIEDFADVLLSADVGPRAVERIVEDIRQAHRDGRLQKTSDLEAYLREELLRGLAGMDTGVRFAASGPTVFLVVGVNGSGKTTTIAKLTHHYRRQGKQVLLAACDTFRAAAVEQLAVWAERLGVDVVRTQRGADPAAVAFDALDAAVARNADLLIVDTAGRLQTKENLMRELAKVERVIAQKRPGAPHEVFLVVDATTGQNGISQARLFSETVRVTGIILTKLDGTARGGVVLGMRDEAPLPVKFIGIGEKPEDLQPFDPAAFVDALLAR